MSDVNAGAKLRQNLELFGMGLGLSLVAKGIALFPLGYSVDSYRKLVAMSTNVAEASGELREFMSQGREGQWALTQLLFQLGIVGSGGNTLYVLVALACYVLVGMLLCHLWKVEGSNALKACIIGLLAIHPYHAEIFTFREATITVGLAVFLAVSGLVLADRRPRRWLAGCALIAGALTMYQIALNYAVAGLAIFGLLSLARSGRQSGSAHDVRGRLAGLVADLLPRASAMAAAVFLYLPVYKLGQQLVPITHETTRGALLPLLDIPRRIVQTRVTIWRVFVVPEVIMPIVVKALVGALLAVAVGLVARKLWAAPARSRPVLIGTALALLGVAVLAIVGVSLPLSEWSPWAFTHRFLSAVSVLVAGSLAVAAVLGSNRTKRVAIAASCVLLASFTGVNNVILSEQLRMNERDKDTANRIIGRLEHDAAFLNVTKLAVSGVRREYPLRYYTTERRGSNTNESAFGAWWAQAQIIQEVSGYRFQEPSPEDMGRADAYCDSAHPWPNHDSVAVVGDTAVICLDGPK
jgi:hypothetical protein